MFKTFKILNFKLGKIINLTIKNPLKKHGMTYILKGRAAVSAVAQRYHCCIPYLAFDWRTASCSQLLKLFLYLMTVCSVQVN